MAAREPQGVHPARFATRMNGAADPPPRSGIRLFPTTLTTLALPDNKRIKRLRFRGRAASTAAKCWSLIRRTVRLLIRTIIENTGSYESNNY
ncbi:MAG: hypothetical protein KDJ65_31985 [Anaerolineae bacterium]|nr:hypothetical protein [Anaerolineae bacterium]